MLKPLTDRLAYALIGFVLGAILSVVLWLLFDAGFSTRRNAPEVHAPLLDWVTYVGGFFAVLGFFFKDRVGSVTGSTMREVYQREANEHASLPGWLVALALLIGLAAAGFWYASAR